MMEKGARGMFFDQNGPQWPTWNTQKYRFHFISERGQKWMKEWSEKRILAQTDLKKLFSRYVRFNEHWALRSNLYYIGEPWPLSPALKPNGQGIPFLTSKSMFMHVLQNQVLKIKMMIVIVILMMRATWGKRYTPHTHPGIARFKQIYLANTFLYRSILDFIHSSP